MLAADVGPPEHLRDRSSVDAEQFFNDERELAEEPTADAEQPKPVRRKGLRRHNAESAAAELVDAELDQEHHTRCRGAERAGGMRAPDQTPAALLLEQHEAAEPWLPRCATRAGASEESPTELSGGRDGSGEWSVDFEPMDDVAPVAGPVSMAVAEVPTQQPELAGGCKLLSGRKVNRHKRVREED
jgi:hypothetical protein